MGAAPWRARLAWKFGCRGWGEGRGRGLGAGAQGAMGGGLVALEPRGDPEKVWGEECRDYAGPRGEDPGGQSQQGGSFGKWKVRESSQSRPSTGGRRQGAVSWGITHAPLLDSQWLPGLTATALVLPSTHEHVPKPSSHGPPWPHGVLTAPVPEVAPLAAEEARPCSRSL